MIDSRWPMGGAAFFAIYVRLALSADDTETADAARFGIDAAVDPATLTRNTNKRTAP